VRFLVVDDEPDTLRFIETAVVRCGHECVTASSVDEASRACSEHVPDALVLDLALPGTDGPTLLRELRDAGQAPDAVMLVSALAPADLEAAADELGVDWLPKPFTADELRDRIIGLAD
jgi:DNA-binding response OmpR family regulator